MSESAFGRRTTVRGPSFTVACVLLASFIGAALALVAAPSALATNPGTESGEESTDCALAWTAESVMNTDLRDDDPTYPGLMSDENGPVTYSNGGYITEVRPEIDNGPGIFEINHWYVGNEPTGPLVTTQVTPVHWRIPISTDHAVTGAQLKVTIPRGSSFTLSSGQNIANWGAPYGNYAWNDPAITHTVSADGLVWTVNLGDLAANSGVVVQFDGQVPAGTTLSEHSVATATLVAAYPPGSGACALTPPATSGNNTDGCVVDWRTDATSTVADGTKNITDVTREEVVSPELGDPGKFGIDGWSTVGSSTGSERLHGRFVLATDEPMTDVTWVLTLDQAIAAPTFTVVNPAMPWRVDGLYPESVTIDAGVWDPAAHTMTYHLSDMPAWSSVVVQYSGDAAPGSYVSGAAYTNTSTVTGTYAEGVASCLEPSTETPSETPTSEQPTDATATPVSHQPTSQPTGGPHSGVETAGSLPNTGGPGAVVLWLGLAVVLAGLGLIAGWHFRSRGSD